MDAGLRLKTVLGDINFKQRKILRIFQDMTHTSRKIPCYCSMFQLTFTEGAHKIVLLNGSPPFSCVLLRYSWNCCSISSPFFPNNVFRVNVFEKQNFKQPKNSKFWIKCTLHSCRKKTNCRIINNLHAHNSSKLSNIFETVHHTILPQIVRSGPLSVVCDHLGPISNTDNGHVRTYW